MNPRISEERLQTAIEHEFECHRCGNCCKGEGLVHFGAAEAQKMAQALGLNRTVFLRQYAIQEGDGWILRDKPVTVRPDEVPELWCIFLERGADGRYGCRINAAKPRQCAVFPATWRNPDTLRTCAGMRALMAKLRKEEPAEQAEK